MYDARQREKREERRRPRFWSDPSKRYTARGKHTSPEEFLFGGERVRVRAAVTRWKYPGIFFCCWYDCSLGYRFFLANFCGVFRRVGVGEIGLISHTVWGRCLGLDEFDGRLEERPDTL